MQRLICILLLTSLFPAVQLYAQQANATFLDSLERKLENPHATDHELFYAYVNLIQHYTTVDLDKAMAFTRRGAIAAKERNSTYWSAEFNYMTGDVFLAHSQLDSALFYFNHSSELQRQAVAEGTEDKEENNYLELYLLNGTGSIHFSQGDFDAALELYLQGLALAERINDPESILSRYADLANTYFRMSNHGQAEKYYLKMEQLSAELNDSTYIAQARLGLCPILNARGEDQKALEYGEEAYRIFQSQPTASYMNLMNAALRLTESWMKIPDYEKAMTYARATVEHARQTGRPDYIASGLYMLSTVYLRMERYAECEQMALLALEADSSNIYINSILYGNIAQANIWLGNRSKGIEYFGKTLNANRAFSNKNFQASLSEMEVKYEMEKKETRIAALEEERRLILWLSISGIIVMFLAITLLFFLWRWSIQKKRLAEQQVKQLEQEKQLVATLAVLDGETAERTRLARDLHDGLGSMLTGVKLNLETIKNNVAQSKPDVKHFNNTLEMLNESITELRRVAHHLMPDSLNRHGLKTALSDFCCNLPNVEFDYFGDEDRLDPKMEVTIYRIIHELVNNALKHSGASQIMVQAMRETGYIAFIVRDNGSGFDTSSDTKGIGLRNIRDRVAFYNGRMDIDSKTNEGTEINIELKVKG